MSHQYRAFLAAAALAAAFAGGPLAGCASSRSLDASVSDLGAGTRLRASLFTDRRHDYGDVDVSLFEGRLLLTGTMRSEEGRQRLIENAWKADGISQVIDEISVGARTSFGQGLRDRRLAAAIRGQLVAERGLTGSDYNIAVSQGVVYVIGKAPDEIQRERALRVISTTAGVTRVVSHLSLMDDAAPLR